MRRLLIPLALGALASCTLRPTYKTFVAAGTSDKEVRLQLVDPSSGAPLPNVRIEMSEWKNRFSTTTAADGTFALPVEKRYLDENPLLVVSLPAGVRGYQLRPAPTVAPMQVPETPAAPPVEPSSEPVKM